jgi:hypothetical protein
MRATGEAQSGATRMVSVGCTSSRSTAAAARQSSSGTTRDWTVKCPITSTRATANVEANTTRQAFQRAGRDPFGSGGGAKDETRAGARTST